MSLNTWQLITRRTFTPIPLTTDVKARVKKMARHQNRPEKIRFQDRLGVEEEAIGDDDQAYQGSVHCIMEDWYQELIDEEPDDQL